MDRHVGKLEFLQSRLLQSQRLINFWTLGIAEMSKPWATVDCALEQLANGGMIIVLDNEDRENEGDLFAAAEAITAETIHFMMTKGRGIICQSVAPEIASRLDLKPLVSSDDLDATNFAMPLDWLGVKSGVSPLDRELTIRAVARQDSKPEQFIRPGHIPQLIAKSNGVFEREGHTEASVDLMRLAGLAPSAVLCEVCSGDGKNMANRDELEKISRSYKIPILRIDQLIEYRQSFAPEFETLRMAEEALNANRLFPSDAENSQCLDDRNQSEVRG